ncbi:MAG: class I SAM-dependent methyltransferase [Candidatus Bathyarchaeota archaeon]|nr:class I SAM-dependent methyltransferase [Candidatus Bathyarchaeota archaeon]
MKRPTPSVIVDLVCRGLSLNSFRGRLIASVIQKKAKNCVNVEEYVDLCFDVFHHKPSKYFGWSIEPIQVKQEIEKLLSILKVKNIKTMLEIGTANGGTLFLFTRIINPDALIISLDLPDGKFGGGYENSKITFFKNLAKETQQIFLIRADSHAASSLQTVKTTLKNYPLDFLFIDGDHSYEGVAKDFAMYSPLVRKGGVIAFHDICKGPPELAGGVHDFWNEIKHSYNYEEIIYNPKQQGLGIGILYF